MLVTKKRGFLGAAKRFMDLEGVLKLRQAITAINV
jgi:hypothetical protein